jgi:TM2 domain-containing membrane protein YozV
MKNIRLVTIELNKTTRRKTTMTKNFTGKKSTGTAYLLFLFCFIGLAGFHRFYIGKIGTGVLYLLTWGWFGIGLIYDLFTIPGQVRKRNEMRYNEI